ncbi:MULTISPECIES: LacI family DNA-binding transcriptional regulator [unclassified Paenibacillus]|uniref:LacI family DNA-binding transcriptional regulator n=1 Tax=unclassified Paenibacillus TaxID=185978 RepID=UPI001C1204B6|nr:MULTISPECIES: LacI family DNA-binding transcriptional regulator [unclassified Paenibacillus]MBU5444975.1 LacI family DNA-binding transcriptional regulator [Paenibacillus sp. MSJ-34]CAH0121277.1 HTH-type transcriptional repressor CytR [Paenibacillus sp. CECT 9249]
MVTIQDVAKEAGVSVATVSRVINRHSAVSARAKKAVEDAIRKLNYEPNILGRNLRTSSTHMILTILPSISNPFYSKVLQGIEDTARKENYYILVCETDSSSEIQSFYLNMAKQRIADGIISLDPTVEQVLTAELDRSYPVIQCGDKTLDERIPFVGIDNVSAAYKAVKYLIAIGHERIALISSSEQYKYAVDRRQGYTQALEEAGIPVRRQYICYSDLNYDHGLQTMRTLLHLDVPPTAVFAVGDVLAIGALKAIRDAGLRCPEDVAVVGFDNIPFASMMNPTLTTVAQPMYEMGCEAARILINKLKNKKSEMQTLIMPHELIIRESTSV